MELLFFVIAVLINHVSSVFSFPVTKNSSSVFSFHSSLKSAVHNFMQNINDIMPAVATSSSRNLEFNIILDNGPIPIKDRMFLINGWRWHTISVLRDLERFRSLSKHSKTLDSDRLIKCYDHVFGFNWNALMRVEKDIFFPWLTDILPPSSQDLIVNIVQKHDSIYSLSKKLKSLCSSPEVFHKNEAVIHKILNELHDCALTIQNTQENYLVPYISAYISKKEQNKFNRKVLSSLGLLNSQIHLVSMFEAIKDKPQEMKIFNNQMPSVARALIPVWRSNFYSPRTSCFE
jgi:hypothetical protein